MQNNEFWKAALVRAVRTVAQVLAASIPADLAITATMIRSADWSFVGLSVLAWLATGLLSGVASLLTSVKTGLPETETRIEYRYMDANGIPLDGHFATVHNIEESVCEATQCGTCDEAETCDLSKYIDETIDGGGENE